MSGNINQEKILIANRGECACRIIRTAKRMGFFTVAVYSEIDINSLHVAIADEAVLLGGNTSNDSYLNINKIIELCHRKGIKYIHPGWGFLSENYHFVEELEKNNIIFVGPSANSMKLLGDKISSKQISKKVGVNISKTSDGIIKNLQEAEGVSASIGFPVILKASAGGGGKGIRVVYSKTEIKDAFDSVKNEARISFGDDRIFIEKFIENPKHIEVQIIGDKFGNVVCLGDRDCSIQRNNQKIIEETPCIALDERTRGKMYAQAIALAKEANYYSAGTLEFLLDKNNDFYFMEMNTRIQVEHTITEMVTGIDLVEQMILVAQGNKLPFNQMDIKSEGHAIECRINAEDPTRNFLPSSGRISKYIEPNKSDSVRVDTGAYEGYNVSMFYDNMIAKLIVKGSDRKDAIEKMQNALGTFFIDGISTNIPFLEALIYNNKYRIGQFTTGFIKQEFSGGFSNSTLDVIDENTLIGTALHIHLLNITRYKNIDGQIIDKNKSNTSNNFVCSINNNVFLCKIISNDSNGIVVEYNNGFVRVNTNWYFGDNIFRAIINNKNISIKIVKDTKIGDLYFEYMGASIKVSIRTPKIFELEKFMLKQSVIKKPKILKAPITGKIIKIMVNIDDEILDGTNLCVIEAMKMENIITAEHKCFIKNIKSKVGDIVMEGDTIMEFEY